MAALAMTKVGCSTGALAREWDTDEVACMVFDLPPRAGQTAQTRRLDSRVDIANQVPLIACRKLLKNNVLTHSSAVAYDAISSCDESVDSTRQHSCSVADRDREVLDINDASQCLALFKSNSRVGLIVFAGLFLSGLLLIP